MHWYLDVLKKYVVFSGRSRRMEYWMFVLINTLISLALWSIVHALHLSTGISSLYSLAVLIPSIAVAVRRLHDIDHSGWWILVGLVPFVGWIVLLLFMIRDSDPDENEYGPNPKEA